MNRRGIMRAAVPAVFIMMILGMVTAYTGAAEAGVTATLSANPTSFTGKCPTRITFTGKITYTQDFSPYVPVTVKYKFLRSDGGIDTLDRSVAFSASDPGPKEVSTTWDLGGSGMTYSGWEAIQIISPVSVQSNKASFSIACDAKPDFIFKQLKLLDCQGGGEVTTPVPGQSICINCEFDTKYATVPAKSFWIRWDVDGNKVSEQQNSIPATMNGGYGTSAQWVAAAGHHTASCTVDSRGEIAEANEQNNAGSITFDVVPPKQKPKPVKKLIPDHNRRNQ